MPEVRGTAAVTVIEAIIALERLEPLDPKRFAAIPRDKVTASQRWQRIRPEIISYAERCGCSGNMELARFALGQVEALDAKLL